MIKFGIKLGIAAGTVYYVADQGVWQSSDNSVKLCNKICTTVSPYTKEISKQIPIEFPSLPQTDKISFTAKHYWNKGVIATFSFLANIPSYVGEWTDKGVNAIMDNTEIKNLFVSSTDAQKAQE